MKKSHKVCTLMLTLTFVLSATACGQKAPVSSSEVESVSVQPVSSVSVPTSSSVASASSSVASAPSAPSTEIADNWDSFQISLDGAVFTFPAKFDDFATAGWVIDPSQAGATMGENTLTGVDLTKGNAEITLTMVNKESGALPIEECSAVGINFDKFDIGDMTVLLPGGITIGSTPEEIIAAYGEPFDKYEGKENGELLSMQYGENGAKRLEISFFNGVLSGIRILVK